MALRFNPSGTVNTYTDTAGVYQLTKSADKNIPTADANVISYTYTAGKLTSITDTQGRTVTFAYADAANPTQPSTITDTSLSRTISLAYAGPGGALSTVTDASGAVTTLGYNATALISVANNGLGLLTTNIYGNGANANNILPGVTNPAGGLIGPGASVTKTFKPTTTGGLEDYQPGGTVDAQGNKSSIFYDPNTRQANRVTQAGADGVAIGGTKTSTFQGDSASTNCGAKTGQVCTTSNGNSNVTRYGYDATGNLTSITPPAPLGARAFT